MAGIIKKINWMDVSLCEVKINDVSVEQVHEFVYLGRMFTRDSKIDADHIEKRVNAGNKANGGTYTYMQL